MSADVETLARAVYRDYVNGNRTDAADRLATLPPIVAAGVVAAVQLLQREAGDNAGTFLLWVWHRASDAIG